MEDQLKKTDMSNFNEGVKVIPYKEVINKGKNSQRGKYIFNIDYYYI